MPVESTQSGSTPSDTQRRAEFVAARNVYLAIILAFLTVCTLAVTVVTRMEASRTAPSGEVSTGSR
jgi:hypothetical protein